VEPIVDKGIYRLGSTVRYEVRLDVFEGPIDLLLHLITRRRVDIYEVSLATITEEFLGAVAGAEKLDLDSATGFLVVAATLLELKSARLLPRPSDDGFDEGLLEERDLLLARLIECATYREAGSYLRGELARGGAFYPRTVSLEPRFIDLAPDLLARATISDLAAAAARALEPRPRVELDVSHVAPIKASVRDAIAEIASDLSREGPSSFALLCSGADRKIDVVVRFLALLELYKAGAIELDQHDRFGDIVASWTGEVAAGDVIEQAEEYTMGNRP
jgi:segregation and condensation protein A